MVLYSAAQTAEAQLTNVHVHLVPIMLRPNYRQEIVKKV